MICTFGEALAAIKAGGHHWKEVRAGSREPNMPIEYANKSRLLQSFFAKGAVIAMNEEKYPEREEGTEE